ncbi:hypothetical protein [Blastococcus saxobsidens]|uniref:Uncharacterized protein n=1 Tax=Blastococcus saxobsidens TaxID=138336 RepID=A0A4Q7YB45_9ACTN|nr:hypothetical protein [Blastococcus saxobsidens]RZU33369.1 hypothetical protein BKA19_3090 [Blastococcus saxobsidens]
MFVFALAAPALLVVVLGYVIGYAVTAWICDVLGAEGRRAPEVVGWTTGLALLGVVTWVLLTRWRRRRKGGHQK